MGKQIELEKRKRKNRVFQKVAEILRSYDEMIQKKGLKKCNFELVDIMKNSSSRVGHISNMRYVQRYMIGLKCSTFSSDDLSKLKKVMYKKGLRLDRTYYSWETPKCNMYIFVANLKEVVEE